jgi:Dolichyl-phosphate-mannose-protein mannosyltransferase
LDEARGEPYSVSRRYRKRSVDDLTVATDPPTKGSQDALWVAGLCALALALRLPGIGASFYGDEGFSLLRDSERWLTTSEDRFRPVYFSLLHVWRQLGFHGEIGLRSLSLAFGVLQIPVAYKLALRLQGQRAALVFGLLLAFNPMLIEFSQELRMYSLVPLIALLQAWAFVEAVRKEEHGRPAFGWWVLFIAAGVMGVYTHFHYWFLLCGFGVASLRRHQELPLRHSLPALAAIALLYLPNIPNLIEFQRVTGTAPHLLATDLRSALPKIVASFGFGFNYVGLPEMGLDRAIRVSAIRSNWVLLLVATVSVLAIFVPVARVLVRRRIGRALALSLELFAVPILLALGAAVVTGRDFIHPKYMVSSAPFSLLLATAGYLANPSRFARYVVAASYAVAIAVAVEHFTEPQRFGRREDWRGAAEFLRPNLTSRDLLITLGDARSPESPRAPVPPQSLWAYYAGDLFDRMRVVHVDARDVDAVGLSSTLRRLSAGKRDIYYLWSEVDHNFNDPNDVLLRTMHTVFVTGQKQEFHPRLVLYRWRCGT